MNQEAESGPGGPRSQGGGGGHCAECGGEVHSLGECPCCKPAEEIAREVKRLNLERCALKKLVGELQYKADLFDYLCWLDRCSQADNPKLEGAEALCLARDGTTCWGKTYAEAVKVAMDYDKGVSDGKEGQNVKH